MDGVRSQIIIVEGFFLKGELEFGLKQSRRSMIKFALESLKKIMLSIFSSECFRTDI